MCLAIGSTEWASVKPAEEPYERSGVSYINRNVKAIQ